MENNNVSKDNTGCMVIIFSLLMILAQIIIDAWLISVMWRWFAVPIFHMRPLSIFAALGVGCLVDSFHSARPRKDEDEPLGEMARRYAAHVAWRAVVLLSVGWAAKSLM